MAKGANYKLKLIYLMKILSENTDDQHGMTMEEIIDRLALYDVTAERKSIYDDFETLNYLGFEIIKERMGRTFLYHVGSRTFELVELKLLVDAIQSSKFITENKSRDLIKKLEGFVSKYEASQLHRQVQVQGRMKSMNESIYYNIDKIESAIHQNNQIVFEYFQWNVDKKMEIRHQGAPYSVSPWELLWDNQNYYMIAFDEKERKIKHYRVDKMLHIELVAINRNGKELFDQKEIFLYTRKHFGMFGGKECNVKIKFHNDLIGLVIDRFGKDIMIHKIDDTHFFIQVEIVVSKKFYGWILGIGKGVEILSPQVVIEDMKNELKYLLDLYENSEMKEEMREDEENKKIIT